LIEVGRVCVKIAGREGGKVCVIIDKIDNNFVLIDGAVRRRKCNVNHLHFLPQVVKIKKKAETKEVIEALKKAGYDVKIKKKKKVKTPKPKPEKKRRSKAKKTKKEEKPKKESKKSAKKESKAKKKDSEKKTKPKEKKTSKKTVKKSSKK